MLMVFVNDIHSRPPCLNSNLEETLIFDSVFCPPPPLYFSPLFFTSYSIDLAWVRSLAEPTLFSFHLLFLFVTFSPPFFNYFLPPLSPAFLSFFVSPIFPIPFLSLHSYSSSIFPFLSLFPFFSLFLPLFSCFSFFPPILLFLHPLLSFLFYLLYFF